MGQYYMPVIKRGYELKKYHSHDFGNGFKLTEHSFVGNNFVNVIANELVENPAQLFWLGDYAQPDDIKPSRKHVFDEVMDFAWNNDARTTAKDCNEEFDWSKDWYFINESTKEFLLMPKEGDWVFTPISLLTAIGNGKGGGDYDRDNDFIGYWAGDVVCLSEEEPDGRYSDISNEVDFGSETF